MNKCCNKHAPVPNVPAASPKESDLVNDLIRSIDRPDEIVTSLVTSPKFLSIKTEQGMGLSASLGNLPTAVDSTRLQKIEGRTLAETAELLHEESLFLRSVGLAAVNAGLDRPTQHGVEGAIDIIKGYGQGKRVGIVGHFPFTPNVREFATETYLFELTDVPGALPRDQWEKVLSSLDVLALTGTSLLTRYMAYYLEHASQALNIVVGPSTPLSPVLFRHGADFICSSKVTNFENVNNGVAQGLSFRQLKKLGIDYVTWKNPSGASSTI
jgi:uncharacterized protein (DUF4213/DUF364 family)